MEKGGAPPQRSRDLQLWVAKMAPPPPSCVLLPLDGCFAVCSTITLALLLFLSKRSPGGLLAWDKALPRAWKRILPLTTEWGATRDPPSWRWPVSPLPLSRDGEGAFQHRSLLLWPGCVKEMLQHGVFPMSGNGTQHWGERPRQLTLFLRVGLLVANFSYGVRILLGFRAGELELRAQ